MASRIITIVVLLAVALSITATISIDESDGAGMFPDFYVGDLQYDYVDRENATVAFNGIRTNSEMVDIPASVEYDGVTYTVVGIAPSALYNEGVSSVSIPSTVTYIGNSAFRGCSQLSEIVIPDGVVSIGQYAFSASGLVSVDIPDSVTTLDRGAFERCSRLTEISIGSGITELPLDVFASCYSLTSVTIPGTVETVDGSFHDSSNIRSITIGDGVKRIERNAFANLPYITSLEIPDSVTYIGPAFSNCTGIGSVVIPDSVVEMEGTFSGCTSLNQVSFGSGLTTLGDDTFSQCAFTEVTVPSSIRTLGDAFSNCISLVDVTIEEGVTRMEGGFSGCPNLGDVILPSTVTYLGPVFPGCVSIKTITIPEGVSRMDGTFMACAGLESVEVSGEISIGSDTFSACTSLSQIDISKFYSIGDGAFQTCTSLTDVEFNDHITTIGSMAFAGCTNIMKVSIPVGGFSTISIGSMAFSDCWNLESVFVGENVTRVGDEAFRDCAALNQLTFLSMGTVGDDIFSGCREISYAHINNDKILDGLDSYASLTTLIIGGNTSSVTEGQFRNSRSLETLIIEEGVLAIDNYAFQNSDALELVAIPDSVIAIGHSTFNLRDGCKVAGPAGCLDDYSYGNLQYGRLVVYETQYYPLAADYSYYQWAQDGDVIQPDVIDVEGYRTYIRVNGSSFFGDSIQVDGSDITITVIYDTQYYNVSFTVDGRVVAEYEVMEGEPIPVPDIIPSKDANGAIGYEFSGWNGFSEGMVADGDRVFESLFDAILLNSAGLVESDGFLSIDVQEDSITIDDSVAQDVADRATSEGLEGLSIVLGDGTIKIHNEQLMAVPSDGVCLGIERTQNDKFSLTMDCAADDLWVEVDIRYYEGFRMVPEVRLMSDDGTYSVEESSFENGHVTFLAYSSADYSIVDVKAPTDYTVPIIAAIVIVAFLVLVMLLYHHRNKAV